MLGILTVWSLAVSIGAAYPFPPYGIAIGWLLSLTSMGPILLYLANYYAFSSAHRRELAGHIRLAEKRSKASETTPIPNTPRPHPPPPPPRIKS